MKHEVKAKYDEALVRTATRRFLTKFLGWDYPAVLIVLLASLIVLLCLGSRGWFVGAIGAVFVIGTLVAVTVWVTFHRRALGALRRMSEPSASFVFDDDGITVASDLGSGTIKWQAVQKLWCFSEVWLIFVGKGAYSTLPTACLTSDARQFIVEKLHEHGTKISQPKVGQVSPEAARSAPPDEPST